MTPRSWHSGRAHALAIFVALALAAAAARSRGDEPAPTPAAASGAQAGAQAGASAVPPGDASAAPPDAASAAPPDAAAAAQPEGADSPFVDEIVVVGQRPRAEVAADPTASATVVSAERFAGEVKTVAQLIATAPGVAVNEYGGLGHFSTVSIRGSNANGVLVLLDGLPLNSEAGGGVDLSSIPRTWIDRIEIVRGPEGAAYGAGALGGVVNVVTRRASAGPPSGETTIGSFGTYAASAEARRGSGRGALLLAASAESSRNDFTYLFDPQPALEGSPLELRRRQNDAAARAGVVAKARLDVGTRRLDALALLSAGRSELPGWPYFLTPDDLQRDARALLTARLTSPTPVSGLILAGRVHARADLVDLTRSPLATRQRDVAGGAEAEALLDHRRGSARLALSASDEWLGGDGMGETRHHASFAAGASEAATVTGGLRIAPAVRLERVGEFSGWSAKIGASVPLVPWLDVRASAGRTFRAPSIAELYRWQAQVAPNPDLQPEVGLAADGGLVAEGRAGFASVGAHVTRYEDLIIYRPATFGLTPYNSLQALVTGLEVEGASAPLSRLRGSIEAAYTLLWSETLEGDAMTLGKELPRRPHNRLFARASIAPGPFGAHVEAHFVSRQFQDDRNLAVVPAATVWNAGASVRLFARPHVRLAAEVRNALDDRTLLDPVGNPLPGRTLMVSIRLEDISKEGRPLP